MSRRLYLRICSFCKLCEHEAQSDSGNVLAVSKATIPYPGSLRSFDVIKKPLKMHRNVIFEDLTTNSFPKHSSTEHAVRYQPLLLCVSGYRLEFCCSRCAGMDVLHPLKLIISFYFYSTTIVKLEECSNYNLCQIR